MSLRWRWATGLGLVAALAIGLITLAAVFSVERQLRGAMDQDLRDRASRVHELTEGLFRLGRERRGVLLPRVVDYDAILQAFDRDGTVLLRIGPEGVTPPVDEADLGVMVGGSPALVRDVHIGGTAYRMITFRVLVRGDPQTTEMGFQILTDQSRLQSNLAALTGQLFLIGAIGVLLVALTGWIMASRAVRPITDLTRAAERVASTDDLDAVKCVDTSAPAEIGRLATAFQSMLDSLQASRRDQQRLVSDAGHEFRTPITALKTNLEVIRRRGGRLEEEEQTELIEAALRESSQLARLASELVDLTSDVRHAAEPVREVDLTELALELRFRYNKLGDVLVRVSGHGAVVAGRPTQLERAAGNLVDNAVKWADSLVEIVLEGTTFTVRDDGPGIPEDDLPNVFRRFYRSAEARSMPGSGLGLAIVDHLIEAHGGSVFAGNSLGGGAEVGFTLPPVERAEGSPGAG